MAHFDKTRQVPTCAACGGWLKAATISFGQPLATRGDRARLRRGGAACDLVLALGSTLSVQPAASIPLVAVDRGVPYVVINRGATDHDDVATLRLEGDVGEILPPAVRYARA